MFATQSNASSYSCSALRSPFRKKRSTFGKADNCPDPSSPPPATSNRVKSPGLGNLRNRRALAVDRFANHSFRVPKPGFSSSDLQISSNISCPVSPIGSPLLHSRSPQHVNGRMSPSPISSGASSPLTSGGGSIPFHHINQSVYLHEISKPTHNPYGNGISYHDLAPHVPDIFQAKQPHSRGCNPVKQSSGHSQQRHGGHAVLADSVSHLLLKEKVNFKPYLDLNRLKTKISSPHKTSLV